MNIKRIIKLINNFQNNIGKRLISDTVIIEGFVEITNGNNHIKFKNSIVDQGIIGLFNIMSCDSKNDGNFFSFNWTGKQNTMILGSDTTTPTTHSTTALTAQIGAPTLANTQSGVTSNPSSGQWEIQWTATWNAGTVSGVLGELGLKLRLLNSLQAFGFSSLPQVDNTFFSRMASADGKFASFTIDNTKPLSITWTFLLTYTT